tara:strand:- start:2446 stop:4002 length:1557 start_codon:yes stop_codon:yes gene_type:complete
LIKKKKHKLIFLIIFILTASCYYKKRNNLDTFIIATYDDVKDWDPATAFSLEVLPLSNIYEPLLWLDASSDDHVFYPALAVSYSKSEDGLFWTFKLRQNVLFHDGSMFDAEVVKYVVERNQSFSYGPSYIWSSVDSVIVDDRYQVTFKLSEPTPMDRVVSSQYGAWMYSKGLQKIDPESLGVGYGSGTGPYMFKKWVKNAEIRLEKFSNYWGGWETKNHFDNVKIKIVSEASTRMQLIESGLVDYAVLLPNQLIEKIKKNKGVKVSYFPSWTNHFYLLNTKKHPTNNIWVRRAISASFDRQTINKYVYGNLSSEAAGLVPSTCPLFIPPDNMPNFNLDSAKTNLDKSNLKDKSLSLDISYVSTSEEYRHTSMMLFDNLRKIGVSLKQKPGLWSINWEKAKHLDTAPNIISMAWWPTYSSPSDWFFGLYKTEHSPMFNLSYYENSVVDSLIAVAWREESVDPGKSKKNYKKIQEILLDDCVVIPAVDLKTQAVYRRDIKGLKPNPAYSTIIVYRLEREE